MFISVLSVGVIRENGFYLNKPDVVVVVVAVVHHGNIYLYNSDPLKPHFYIVKLGLTGIYIIFVISVQKHRLWLLVRTASTRRF